MSELTRERIKEIRDGGTNMARRAAIHGWLIKICDMALRTLDAEARNRKLEAALRDIARGPLQEPMDFATYAKNVAANALTTAPPDSEPAEGAGGGDGIPQCSCVTKTPDWRHHDASCNYRVYMEDSFPPQWKGEPTVRESTHGGYVWTCCDECGPDVKVDEDGLCIACGRNAVYFGKKHPDDTPPQSRDAGDILREKLSDPKAMQRVTERAAERQDAMLERREQAEGLLREARLCLLDDKRVGNLCHRIDDHFGERDE